MYLLYVLPKDDQSYVNTGRLHDVPYLDFTFIGEIEVHAINKLYNIALQMVKC